MTKWDEFFQEKLGAIFKEKHFVVDIGNGLRVIKEKGNRYDPEREWLRPHIEKVRYEVMDAVPTYNPDIVGDIQKMPFEDNSVDAIICIAVLQYVENPLLAMKEILRVLKPGGYAFVYVPFLYYYSTEPGYYNDYWRFTEDSLPLLGKGFKKMESSPIRGAIETWIKLSPLGRSRLFTRLARLLDALFHKDESREVSGYNIFLVK